MVHQRMPLNTGNLLPTLERSFPGDTFSLLQAIARRASEIQTPLYLVGGSVRDLLMGTSLKDVDLVVEGDAPSLASEIARDLSGEVLAHARFGTATVKLGGHRFDLATARQETYPRAGALPTVSPSSIQPDLGRRDLTINAMAIGLSGREPGRLLDPCGGETDLRMGIVRVLHPGSFVDDATRILRAVRYEQRLGFTLQEDTRQHLVEAIERRMLRTVGEDRLRKELHLVFEEKQPHLALQRSGELGILSAIYPPLQHGPGVQKLVGHRYAKSPMAYLGALAYPLSADEAEGFIKALRMPSEWARVVRDTVAVKQRCGGGTGVPPPIGNSNLAIGDMCEFLDRMATTGVQVNAALSDHLEVREVLEMYLTELRHVKPLLKGADLIALGVCEGPAVGAVLRELRIARIEGRTHTRDDETRLARQSITRGRLTLDGA